MKVLQVVTQMEAAGAQVAAMSLHRKWLNDGVDAKILFLYDKTSAYKNEFGVDILITRKPTSVISFFIFFIKLFSYIKNEDPSTIVCHTTYSNIFGGLASFLCRVKRVIVVHHGLIDHRKKISNLLDRLMGMSAIYHCIVCVSNAVRDEYDSYPKRYLNKLKTIYNGVEVNIPLHSEKYNYIEHGNFINLASVGRLHPQKNQKVLLNVLLRNNKIRIFLVGEGELRPFFEDFIREHSLQDRLVLLGELPRDEVFQVILRSDIFVFPSASEAFGLSLLEAMFIGKPVVTSDLACFKEILGSEGIYLPTNSPSAWENFFCSDFSKQELDPIKRLVIERSKLFTFDKMYKAYCDLL